MKLRFTSTLASSPKHRADIDGLRAIAILSVLFYHAGFSLFSGGYVGVDVFFVISGFLITSIIARDIDKKSFSYVGFYERRIRRIFPALFAMTLFTVIGGAILLVPNDFISFGKNVIAMTAFVSNMFFNREFAGDGYFGNALEMQVLLHTWSLSVEEQFYIFFPAFLIISRRWAGRYEALFLFCVILGSFALSLWAVEHKPIAAFFLLAPRAWELLLGSILAVKPPPKIKSQPVNEGIGLLGVALILYAVFGLTKQSPFPGANALFPCIGAFLIIYVGASGTTFLTKILSARPAVFIGLISYSLYLWHWPIIVFSKYFNVGVFKWQHAVICVVLSLIMAFLSFEYVELPFRRKGNKFTRNQIYLLGGIASLAAIIIGIVIVLGRGVPQRYAEETREILAKNSLAKEDYLEKCSNFRTNIMSEDEIVYCKFGNNAAHNILFYGDSHVQQLLPLIDKMQKEGKMGDRGAFFAVSTGCPPSPHLNEIDRRYHCNTFARAAMSRALKSDIDVVYIGFSPWFSTVDNMLCDTGEGIGCLKPLSRMEAVDQFISDLSDQIDELQNNGKTVILSLPFPLYDRPIPDAQMHNAVFGNYIGRISPMDITPASLRSRLLDLAKTNEVMVFDPHKDLCPQSSCIYQVNNISIYKDANHITASEIGIVENEMTRALHAAISNP